MAVSCDVNEEDFSSKHSLLSSLIVATLLIPFWCSVWAGYRFMFPRGFVSLRLKIKAVRVPFFNKWSKSTKGERLDADGRWRSCMCFILEIMRIEFCWKAAKLESDAEKKDELEAADRSSLLYGKKRSFCNISSRQPWWYISRSDATIFSSLHKYCQPCYWETEICIVDYIGSISMMIYGLVIAFLEALPLIVANPLPADPISLNDPNQLLSIYSDPNALSLVPNLGNQGSPPSIGFDTSTYDSLESIAVTDPGAVGTEVSAGVCDNEGAQPGAKTNAKLSRRQGESCASSYKNTLSPSIAPPKPVELPDLREPLIDFPPPVKPGPEENECKRPFANRFCCEGPVKNYQQVSSPAFPHGFYGEVDHCRYCRFLTEYLRCKFFSLEFIGTPAGCLSPANDFCCIDREVTVLHAIHLAILETESWPRIRLLLNKEINQTLWALVVLTFTCRGSWPIFFRALEIIDKTRSKVMKPKASAKKIQQLTVIQQNSLCDAQPLYVYI